MGWLRTNGYGIEDADGWAFLSSDGGGGDVALWQQGKGWVCRYYDSSQERVFMTLNARDVDEAIDKAEVAIESWWKEPDLEREDLDRDDL
jgi:hypothetical protein